MIKSFVKAATSIAKIEDLKTLERPFFTLLRSDDEHAPDEFYVLYGSLTGRGIAGDKPVIVASRHDSVEPAMAAFGKYTKPINPHTQEHDFVVVDLSEACLKDLISYIHDHDLLAHDLPESVLMISDIPETIEVLGALGEKLDVVTPQ